MSVSDGDGSSRSIDVSAHEMQPRLDQRHARLCLDGTTLVRDRIDLAQLRINLRCRQPKFIRFQRCKFEQHPGLPEPDTMRLGVIRALPPARPRRLNIRHPRATFVQQGTTDQIGLVVMAAGQIRRVRGSRPCAVYVSTLPVENGRPKLEPRDLTRVGGGHQRGCLCEVWPCFLTLRLVEQRLRKPQMCLQQLPVVAATAVEARQQRMTDLHDDGETPDDRSDFQRVDVDLDEQLGVVTGVHPSFGQPPLRGPHRPDVEGLHRPP